MESPGKKKQVQPKTHAPKTRVDSAIRRKKIIQAKIKGKTNKEAGMLAGLSPKTANTQVSQILSEPNVKTTMAVMLEKVGITDEYLGNLHREQCQATKVISATVIAGKGQQDASAATTDFIDVPDNTARINALKLAYQVKGHLIERVESKHSMDGATMAAVAAYLSGKK